MIDKRFFDFAGPQTLDILGKVCAATLFKGEAAKVIGDVAPLERAQSGHISFLHNKAYLTQLKQTKASAVLVAKEHAAFVPEGTAVLVASEPLKAFSLVLQTFYKEKVPKAGVHESAIVADSVTLGKNCTIGPGCVLGEGVSIGEGSVLGAHVVVKPGVSIGAHAVIDDNVTLQHAIIGNHVRIKTGARIGQKGFGFFMGKDVKERLTQPQLGRVVIGCHVEVGANTTIDRGSLKDTVVEDHVRIDNLVQIAHNVHVGQGSVIVAQAGIAGSAHLEKGVVVAGQAGISGHLKIGAFARIGGQSGVARSLTPGEEVVGSPAIPRRFWHWQNMFWAKLYKEKKAQKEMA